MASLREDYVILSEVLRKMDTYESYVPTDYENKVVVSLLEREEKNTLNQLKSRKNSNFDF